MVFGCMLVFICIVITFDLFVCAGLVLLLVWFDAASVVYCGLLCCCLGLMFGLYCLDAWYL